MTVMKATTLVRITTELAAVMPSSHTRYLFPLARLSDEPLGSEHGHSDE